MCYRRQPQDHILDPERFTMQMNWMTIAAIIVIVVAIGFFLMRRRAG